MNKLLIPCILCLSLAMAAGGCNLIYKQNIQQGNVIEQDQVDQLETGMSKRQVSLIMGTPAIVDPFHADRWDYVYRFRPRGRTGAGRSITLYFENNALTRIEGEVANPYAEPQTSESETSKTETNQPATAAPEAAEPEPAASESLSQTQPALPEPPPAAVQPTREAVLEPQAETRPEVTATSTDEPVWTVQLGHFSDRQNAESLLAALASHDINAQMRELSDSGENRYRVYAGAFNDKSSAESLRHTVQQQMDIEGFVLQLPVSP